MELSNRGVSQCSSCHSKRLWRSANGASTLTIIQHELVINAHHHGSKRSSSSSSTECLKSVPGPTSHETKALRTRWCECRWRASCSRCFRGVSTCLPCQAKTAKELTMRCTTVLLRKGPNGTKQMDCHLPQTRRCIIHETPQWISQSCAGTHLRDTWSP